MKIEYYIYPQQVDANGSPLVWIYRISTQKNNMVLETWSKTSGKFMETWRYDFRNEAPGVNQIERVKKYGSKLTPKQVMVLLV